MIVHNISLIGHRKENEDRHTIITKDEVNVNNLKTTNINIENDFFAVYDGHGGKYVSQFLHNNLPYFFIDKRVKYPLQLKYINTVFDYFQNIFRKKKESQHCGSTCCIVVRFNDAQNHSCINVINTGDSRAVICRNNIGLSLTKDHKPHWPEEHKRITDLNGNIYWDGDDWRIKDLSVSRSFGDVDAEPFLTHLPDIFKYKIYKEDKFIIIACDGLWDVLSSQDAVNFILREAYDSNNSIKKHVNIAKRLADHAIEKGSYDNVTIIVAFL
jgi:serine/threonine protein phosphatase PrpC